MRKVLIVGEKSYIGDSFAEYVTKDKDIQIDIVDSMNDNWKVENFSEYDSVFHVAGIAHALNKNIAEEIYYSVNRDLAIDVANYAKEKGVRQLVFMSSMSVYTDIKEKCISHDTKLNAKGAYGDSKLQADLSLQEMYSDDFNIAILRPPMIYGAGCKGNFPRLVGLVKKLPIFPNFNNKRSMLYIDNLCEFVYQIIVRQESGIFFPQNSEYVKTTDIARVVNKVNGKKVWYTRIFNLAIYPARAIVGALGKVFGDLVYDKSISNLDWNYNVVDFEKSVQKSIQK